MHSGLTSSGSLGGVAGRSRRAKPVAKGACGETDFNWTSGQYDFRVNPAGDASSAEGFRNSSGGRTYRFWHVKA